MLILTIPKPTTNLGCLVASSGNTLTVRVPDFELPGYSHQDLANLCLPDGAHLYTEDRTYLVLPLPEDYEAQSRKLIKARKRAGASSETALGTRGQSDVYLFGVALYHNKRDPTMKRGAVQRSMLLLLTEPVVGLFLPVLRECLSQYMETPDTKLLKQLLTSLNKAWASAHELVLWGRKYPLNRPVIRPEAFHGANVAALVQRFQEDTILIWRGILLQYRVLFLGRPAHQVSQLVISAPFLVRPLRDLLMDLHPYVALTDVEPMFKPRYIAGTTNLLFETKSEWYDLLGSLDSGHLVPSARFKDRPLKITPRERKFIRSVLHGIEDKRGEKWVRVQFENFTRRTLDKLINAAFKSREQQLYKRLTDSEMFRSYRERLERGEADVKDAGVGTGTGAEALDKLVRKLDGMSRASPPDKALPGVLFNLNKQLGDLDLLEQVLDAGIVPALQRILEHEQVKASSIKWCALILSQLALSVRGQILILTTPILIRVLDLMDHDLVNVQSAALQCLSKVSTLQIGTAALVSRQVHHRLFALAEDVTQNLQLRTQAAQTLAHIARVTEAPAPAPTFDLSVLPARITGTPDRQLKTYMILVCDSWDAALPDLEPRSSEVEACMAALRGGSLQAAQQQVSALLQTLSASPSCVFELIQAGALPLLVAMAITAPDNVPPTRAALLMIQHMADTHAGRLAFLQAECEGTESSTAAGGGAAGGVGSSKGGEYTLLGALHTLLRILYLPAVTLYLVLRVFEAFVQHPRTAVHLVRLPGFVPDLVQFITKFLDDPTANYLVVPAISILLHLFALLPPEARPALAGSCQPLAGTATYLQSTLEAIAGLTPTDGDGYGDQDADDEVEAAPAASVPIPGALAAWRQFQKLQTTLQAAKTKATT